LYNCVIVLGIFITFQYGFASDLSNAQAYHVTERIII
jgi:hypothetical protein